MNVSKLIEALKRLGIAEVRSISHSGGESTYLLEGRLPELPLRSRSTSYKLKVTHPEEFVEPREVEILLRHYWKGQLELRELKKALGTPADLRVT